MLRFNFEKKSTKIITAVLGLSFLGSVSALASFSMLPPAYEMTFQKSFLVGGNNLADHIETSPTLCPTPKVMERLHSENVPEDWIPLLEYEEEVRWELHEWEQKLKHMLGLPRYIDMFVDHDPEDEDIMTFTYAGFYTDDQGNIQEYKESRSYTLPFGGEIGKDYAPYTLSPTMESIAYSLTEDEKLSQALAEVQGIAQVDVREVDDKVEIQIFPSGAVEGTAIPLSEKKEEILEIVSQYRQVEEETLLIYTIQGEVIFGDDSHKNLENYHHFDTNTETEAIFPEEGFTFPQDMDAYLDFIQAHPTGTETPSRDSIGTAFPSLGNPVLATSFSDYLPLSFHDQTGFRAQHYFLRDDLETILDWMPMDSSNFSWESLYTLREQGISLSNWMEETGLVYKFHVFIQEVPKNAPSLEECTWILYIEPWKAETFPEEFLEDLLEKTKDFPLPVIVTTEPLRLW